MIDNLVMDENRVRTLKALAKSFTRTDRTGATLGRAQWTADFVQGKGHGLLALLHGKPGVGKTCTAGKSPTSDKLKHAKMTNICQNALLNL